MKGEFNIIGLNDLMITLSDLDKNFNGNFQLFFKDKLKINIKKQRKDKLLNILK
jgi:hypothetical protein